jgi:hypothetical protein
VRYQLKPIEIGEAGLADIRICNEFDEPVVTFIFPDSHEACIARALMIRATANAVLIIPAKARSRRKCLFAIALVTMGTVRD